MSVINGLEGGWTSLLHTRPYRQNPTNAPKWIYEYKGRSWAFNWQILTDSAAVGRIAEIRDVTGNGLILPIGTSTQAAQADVAALGGFAYCFRTAPGSNNTFSVDKYNLETGARTADIYQVSFGISANPSAANVHVNAAPWSNKIWVAASAYFLGGSGTRSNMRYGVFDPDTESVTWHYVVSSTTSTPVIVRGISSDDTYFYIQYSISTTYYRKRFDLDGSNETTTFSGSFSTANVPKRGFVGNYGLWAGDPRNDHTVRDWPKDNAWDLDLAASSSGLVGVQILSTDGAAGVPYHVLAVYANGEVHHVKLAASSVVTSQSIGSVGAITTASDSTALIGIDQTLYRDTDGAPYRFSAGGETAQVRVDMRRRSTG